MVEATGGETGKQLFEISKETYEADHK